MVLKLMQNAQSNTRKKFLTQGKKASITISICAAWLLSAQLRTSSRLQDFWTEDTESEAFSNQHVTVPSGSKKVTFEKEKANQGKIIPIKILNTTSTAKEEGNTTWSNTTVWLRTQRQKDPTKPRLEFLHLQKNAGTYFEKLALEHGLPWGACHFNFPWKMNRQNILKNCPPIRDAPMQRDCYWHYPIRFLPKQIGPNGANHKPYDNNHDPLYAARPKKYFAVVRNPYARLVSFFVNAAKNGDKNSGDKLNEWVQMSLRNPKTVGLNYPNATICQYSHFYDNDGTRMVDHIIHFESLLKDFGLLIQEYDLPSTFAPKKVRKVNTGKRISLTYKNFDNETVKLINQVCEKDFNLGGRYSKIYVE